MNDKPITDQIDAHLAVLREAWQDAAQDRKAYWMTKINASLDKRLEAMKRKDTQ
jgi:hypothetical protein